MTLTKSRIIDSVQEETGLPRKRCDELVEELLEIIKETLANGENLMVSGFGKFCVKEKKARKGRNPATGDDLMLDERKVVTFKCSQGLREKINGS
ncbi:MAG: integration host factor subunit alpha [Thermodesulfobacteriota bacterium]|jgi:integration host factor subunit alpha|uniref:Integration host factor subunit alpha n=1 Tax=Desulfosudis oleivorans (strain DSM 6200 / JCM 39069 / Hxd3) TaxID=96561 RepID=A8ZWY5_DESOH|nr:integration host factor subunit alpha [Desulfosudis oleivorans]ABW66841.1 histone family protein DNA-binding protein [Desulfosudis oleivorans Hxd3]MDY6831247.1 integration host factor subunit alpha [Thermodesulfobacteriota bacterium]